MKKFRARPKTAFAAIGSEDDQLSIVSDTISVGDSAEGDGLLSIGALNVPC